MSRDAHRRSENRRSKSIREEEASLTRGTKSRMKSSTDVYSGKSSANTEEHSGCQVYAKSTARTTEGTKPKGVNTNKEKQPKGVSEPYTSCHMIEDMPPRDMPRSPNNSGRAQAAVSPRSSKDVKNRRGSTTGQTGNDLKPPDSGYVARSTSPQLRETAELSRSVEFKPKKTKSKGKIIRDEHVEPTSCINFAFEHDEGSSPNFRRKNQTQAVSAKPKMENPQVKNSTAPPSSGEFTKYTDAELKIAPMSDVKGKPPMQTLKENEEIARFRDYNYGACSSNGNFKQNLSDAEIQPKYATAGYAVKQNILRENIPNIQNQFLQDSENEKEQTIRNTLKTFQEPRESDISESLPAAKPARRLPYIRLNEDSSFAEVISRRPSDFGDLQSTRAPNRSFSLTPQNKPLEEFQRSLQPQLVGRLQPVGRSQSMRLASTADQPEKPKKLLHELSFADTENTDGKNYGALRRRNSIRKRSVVLETVQDSDDDFEDELGARVPAKFKADLLLVMQELLNRGKVKQVAVVDQTSSNMLVSLPPWNLSSQDIVGLVKAVTCPQQLMLKLAIGREVYTCFTHGSNKLVGRNGEKVLVTQKTNTCVVVGVAVDDTPGSCMYEVSELSRALIDKEW